MVEWFGALPAEFRDPDFADAMGRLGYRYDGATRGFHHGRAGWVTIEQAWQMYEAALEGRKVERSEILPASETMQRSINSAANDE